MLKAGDRIGDKYRLTREIGAGAMGVVWAAVNELTSREVALKLVLRSTDELRHRLLKEAKITGSLSNRHIIEVLDVGQTETGDPFLVMPLLFGETLADVLARQRRIDPPIAAEIARDIARALESAHAAGIIHRDLKPANIFLHRDAGTDETIVKVLDFGVSKSLSARDTMVGTPAVAGGGIGSPAYMSPEQMRVDKNIDQRSDLWSIGVVLFEMLTGVRPFQGETQQIIRHVISGEIPNIANLVRFVDSGLIEVVSRCLQRDREARMATATELVQALNRFTRDPRGESSRGAPSRTTPAHSDPRVPLTPPSSTSASYNAVSDAADAINDADEATLQYRPAMAAKLVSSQRAPLPITQPLPAPAPPVSEAPPRRWASTLKMDTVPRSTLKSASPLPLPAPASAEAGTAPGGAFGTFIINPEGTPGRKNALLERLRQGVQASKDNARSSSSSRLVVIVVAVAAGLSVALLIVVVAARLRPSSMASASPSSSSSSTSSSASPPVTSLSSSIALPLVPSSNPSVPDPSAPSPSIVGSSTARSSIGSPLVPPTVPAQAAAQARPAPAPTKPPSSPQPTSKRPAAPPPKPSSDLIERGPIFQ